MRRECAMTQLIKSRLPRLVIYLLVTAQYTVLHLLHASEQQSYSRSRSVIQQIGHCTHKLSILDILLDVRYRGCMGFSQVQ